MKIFEPNFNYSSDKYNSNINFVDDNNVMVGFNMGSDCCEHFGWFIRQTQSTTELPNEKELNKTDIDVSGYNFDKDYFVMIPSASEYDSGGMVIFRLTKGEEELFLHLFNYHNGYYAHGFNMDVDGQTIKSDSL